MKFYSLKVLVASILFCLVALLQAQDILILGDEKKTDQPSTVTEIPTDNDLEVSAANFLSFYNRWRDFELAYNQKNFNEVQKVLQQIIDLKKQTSIERLPEFANALIPHGKELFAQGKVQEAIQLFQSAITMDPALSPAYYAGARAYLAKGPSGLLSALILAVRGFLAPSHSLSGKVYLNSKVALLVVSTFVCLGVIFALGQMLKYRHLLEHNLVEKLELRYQAPVVRVMTWVLLFVPVLLLFGPLWLAPFWLMIFWAYGRKGEKFLSVIFFIAFILAFPVYSRLSHLALAMVDPVVNSYLTGFGSGPSPKTIRDLEEYLTKNPEDENASIYLAYLHRKDENIPTAIDLLQQHILRHPQDSRAYNNLAVIYFNQGQTEQALRLEEKAVDLNPTNALYLYNLSGINRAKFNFDEAERLLQEARQKNPSLIQTLEETFQEKVIDSIPSAEFVMKMLQEKTGSFSKSFFNPFSISSFVFLALAIGFYSGEQRRQSLAKECVKCGTAFCKKCQSSGKVYGFCTQCLHIFVKKDGVSPASRKEKMEAIDTYSRRQRFFSRIFSLILPGFGHLYQDKPLSGTLILLVWILAFALFFFSRKFVGMPYFESSDATRALAPVCFLLVVIAFLAGNLPLYRKTKV